MPLLKLNLLGRPEVKLDDKVIELVSHKAQALLYYLAVTQQTHSRQGLAGLLWSDLDESAARRNLRVELLKLRNEVDAFLLTTRDTIAFDRESNYALDVAFFERNLTGKEPTFAQLQEVVACYRGDFLEDFHTRDAPLFEEWVTNEQERLRQLARHAMLRLTLHYIQQAAYDSGIACINQLLKREPWLEEAHQLLMRLLALSGQRSAALAQYEICSQILNDEFGVPPSDETNALYDQIEQGEIGAELQVTATPPPTASPPPRAATPLPPPFQAPPPLLHFVGRTEQFATLHQHLTTANGKRLCALVGMGGVGKTTLATHIAHTLRADFVDGVLWAYAAGSEPLDILGGWAQAYGYDFSSISDVENRAAALRGVLAEKQILFALDDVRSMARVRPLLVGGARSATLLTTRDLDVATALGSHIYSLEAMTPQEGTELLARILGEERVAAELEATHTICSLLHHLPLAVEITAQRLLSRPRRRLADMARRLQDVQERLDLAISDRAVRTSFMVSWESLDSELRRVFALLGVFQGRSFAPPALAHLAALDVYSAEDRLFALTALSLLTEEAEDRYRQHPLLADFALEQLGDQNDAPVRMAAYYLGFAQDHQTNYTALQPEWENLMASMETAHARQEWRLVLDYADTLTEPWFTRARYGEARQAYLWMQGAAERLADNAALATCCLKWGQACIEQYDYDEADALLLRSLTLHQRHGLQAGVAHTQYHRARIALERAQYDLADELLQESQAQFIHLQDQAGISVTMYQQALLAYRRGRLAVSRELCQRILAMKADADPFSSRLPTLRLLADIDLEEEAYETAEMHCKQALALCEQLHNRSELAGVYYSLTVVARCQMNFAAAKKFAQQALELCDLTGNRGDKALTLHELSRIHVSAGNYALAIQSSEESYDLLVAVQDYFNMVYILRQLGEAHSAAGEYDKAKAAWKKAYTIAQSQHHPLTEQIQAKLC
ncbi:MAG: BTAD domain-containing putative transcriptional regulator [Caldilineaceae bacterium]